MTARLNRATSRIIVVAAILLIVGIPWPMPVSAATEAPDLVVCATCEVTTLQDALAQAPDGARIEVRGGTYAGPLQIERDVELIGIDRPVIDGGGEGTIIHATGAAVTISGFIIRGTGTTLDHEDSGILVEKGHATIVDNIIEDSLFGIYLKESPGSILRDNIVRSKPLPIALRGDGVKVWYSDDMVIEGNQADDGRDVILWYSNRGIVRNNEFNGGRYGLHLMFSDSATVEYNSLSQNSIGLYIMYSRDAIVRGNILSNNHGPSGGGLGLKDVDGLTVEANRFVNNRIGAQVDTSPREPNIEHYWIGNVFAYNEVALGIMPSVKRNTLTENSFIDNVQNVTILGGGELKGITWSVDGRGNYWSDYAGYDANGDGVGDVPYLSQHLFESLMDDHPQLRLFLFSPAAMAVDFAAEAFPAVRPRTRFVDDAPLMAAPAIADLPGIAGQSTSQRLVGGAVWLLIGGAALGMILSVRRRSPVAAVTPNESTEAPMSTPAPVAAARPQPDIPSADAVVAVRNVTKRYGRVAAVDAMSFSADRAEAIALWGPNGAGKTTILRCLLGVARYSGDIRINGANPARDGRGARRQVGYVPQDLAPSAMTVAEMVEFVAALKRAPSDEGFAHLEMLGIADARDKTLSALSGGMKQRLALALALIGDPSILLLDEPTANLDAAGRAELLDLLREQKQRGKTLIFSSHRPDDILALADRILLMRAGQLEEIVTPQEFASVTGSEARLIVTLSNGHATEAAETLASLGLSADISGKRLVVTIEHREKARVLSALARRGVEIDDFELERGLWTGQQ